MPVCFGPMPGPRQSPIAPDLQPKRRTISFAVPSEEGRLNGLLASEFRALPPFEVLFDVTFLSDLAWLGGGGYAMVGCRLPAIYSGAKGDTVGYFLAVLFENLADPILSGREELGYAKLYCEIETTLGEGNSERLSCSWRGHTFAEFEFSDPSPASEPLSRLKGSQGLLHHRYFPATGAWGTAALSEATLSPVIAGETEILQRESGTGRLAFTPGELQDLPTLHHIVSGLASLATGPVRAAERWTGQGLNDHADQIVLGPVTAPGAPGRTPG